MDAINQLEALARKDGDVDVANAIANETFRMLHEHDVWRVAEAVKFTYLISTGTNGDMGEMPESY